MRRRTSSTADTTTTRSANLSQPLPFPDALQEFKVESGVRPARYGVLPGATVNAVTKAGANDFHGTGFAFFRDHNLNARNAFCDHRRWPEPAAVGRHGRRTGRAQPRLLLRRLPGHPACG